MHVSAAALQTVGTVLQLAGAMVTLGGLAWAWHTGSGLLRQWRNAVGDLLTRLTRFRDAVHEIVITPGPAKLTLRGGQPDVQVTPGLSGHGELAAMAQALDATENRLNELEHAHQAVRDQLTALDPALRPEIDAIADELKNVKAEHLQGLYPALGGIVVSIMGLATQLVAYLIA